MINRIKSNRKGLHWAIIAGMIFIVFTIAVLAFFLSSADLVKNGLNKVCEQSVILRTAPLGDKAVPLNCQTSKICISKGFLPEGVVGAFSGVFRDDNCVSIKNPIFTAADKSQVTTVSGNKQEENQQIDKILADTMYNCWAMMGKGQLNFMGTRWDQLTSKKYCFVCARIGFSDEIKKEFAVIPGWQPGSNADTGGIKGFDYYLEHEGPEGSDKTYLALFNNGIQPVQLEGQQLTDKINNDLETQNIDLQQANTLYQDLPYKVDEKPIPTNQFIINPNDQVAFIYILNKPGQLSKSSTLWTIGAIGGLALVIAAPYLAPIVAGYAAGATGVSAVALGATNAVLWVAGTGVVTKLGSFILPKVGLGTGLYSVATKGDDGERNFIFAKYDKTALENLGCSFEIDP